MSEISSSEFRKTRAVVERLSIGQGPDGAVFVVTFKQASCTDSVGLPLDAKSITQLMVICECAELNDCVGAEVLVLRRDSHGQVCGVADNVDHDRLVWR